ncbi:MAG: glycosyltransferase family 39 protein [Thermoguttaceae bacterium]|nr:glycosyltransferase family 39 protein [Thermoguttaceae bacterium]
METETKRTILILAVILLVGLLVRLSLLLVLDGSMLQIVDETHYDALAVHLLETGIYGSEAEAFVSIRPPLYPWLVSEIYRVFGVQNYTAVRVVQIFLSLLTVLCVYGLARECGFLTPNASLAAAGTFCFYPSLVVQNFFLLTETFFTFWLVLVLWSAVRFLRTGSIYAACFCGTFIALGALTRSILWLSPFPLALFILFWPNESPVFTWKRRLAAALALLVFAGVGMAPWMIRNTRIQKTFVAIDCMSGRNLMMGNYEYTPLYRAWDAISMEPPKDWYTVMKRDWAKTHDGLCDALTQGQKDRLAGEYAKNYMKSHPAQTLERTGMKALCFWQLERSIPAGIQRGFWGLDRLEETPRKVVFLAVTCIVMVPFALIFQLAVLGIFSLEFTRKTLPQIVLLLAVLLYFWALHSLAFAHERYHLPLIPIVVLFAVSLFQNAPAAWLRLRKTPLRWAPAVLLSAAYLVFWCCEVSWAI